MKPNLIFCIILFAELDKYVNGNLQNDILRQFKEDNSTIISRKRRYLVFPEGSSFQVVFDLTYPSVAIQGNVFMFGHTAAMAWELPSTPIFLDKKKMKKEEKLETTTIEPTFEHLDHSHSSENTQAWQPPLLWNYDESPDYAGLPFDADKSFPIYHINEAQSNSPQYFEHNRRYMKDKYSDLYGSAVYKNNVPLFWDRKTFGRSLLQRIATKSHPSSQVNKTVVHHIQRRSRRELYTKVEKLLSALSKDGKACVLKAICQVNKLPPRKGTLWEEILKAAFKTRHGMYPEEDRYDRAANIDHDCDKRYPSCDGHVLSSLFKNRVQK